MKILANNLKRLRLSKNLTQEQVADVLGVSAQSVSRWECNTTMPDVSMLPQIARLYCVTIDDLYRETSVAYENYAQRLLSVYEATHKVEDFLQAELEFRKLLKTENHSDNDLRLYGILHQYMMHYCMEKAEELFDRVLKKGPAENPETYWSVKRQKNYFLHQIGRNTETIDEFLPLIEAGSADFNAWICLIQAFGLEKESETALKWAQKAEKLFPDNASLHICMGDLCRDLKRYEEAFIHWNRARELAPQWLDAAYSMGFCYEELEQYENAHEIWCRIADELAERGYESEVLYPRSLADKCLSRISSQ